LIPNRIMNLNSNTIINMTEKIQFNLNGKDVNLTVDPNLTLMWVLRVNFGLTGTKFGCGLGFCGACTVLMENEPVRSCMLTVGDIGGFKIQTIEGLEKNGSLHPIQQAFMAHDALQCGFCTPGMIMNAYGLLLKNPEPTRNEIIDAMENNLCRCGTYNRIIEAIQSASREMKKMTAV
jgi:aerobic-type carbon monoxide dehydrogenase small subunit (CoxS/CutS family)